jgi:hypothetical protein
MWAMWAMWAKWAMWETSVSKNLGKKMHFFYSEGALSGESKYLFDETFNESNSLLVSKLNPTESFPSFRIAVAHYRASKNLV